MKMVLQIVSWIALLGTVLPSILFFSGQMDLDTVKTVMNVMTLIWFIITPLWMGKEKNAQNEGTEVVP